MYEDTILPVRNKVRIPSESQTRIYFVQEQTKNALFFIKWVELVMCLLCLCFAILAINATDVPNLSKIVILLSGSSSIVLVLVEISYQYFKRPLSLLLQVLSAAANFAIYGMVIILIYQTNNSHDLVKTLLFLNGFTSVMFLIDITCKIIISTYLYQRTRVKSVVDVAVSAFLPPPSPAPGRSKPYRSVLTTTPITYGGTFPIGKNQPPFVPEDRNPPAEGCQTPEKGSRQKWVQTAHCGDNKAVGGLTFFDFGPLAVEKSMTKSKNVQTNLDQEEKDIIPPYYLEEVRRKKSPWTCSTPTTSRKIDARRQASMSTPITYSGTFAVNKELVPIAPAAMASSSPNSSPRGKKPCPRSAGNSPTRSENVFQDTRRLDQISEEKISLQMSSENCSLTRSNCAFYDAGVLPGGVLEDDDYGFRKKMKYELI